VARDECLFAWNFSLTRSTVFTEAGEDKDQTDNHYTSNSLLAYSLKTPPAKNHAPHYNNRTQNVHKMITENHVKLP